MLPPVNFVVPYPDEVIAQLRNADPDLTARSSGDHAWMLAAGGPAAWCYLTYRRLAMSGYGGIGLSNAIDPEAINVVHSGHLNELWQDRRAFVVSAQADHAQRFGAQFHIVQNRRQAAANSVWIHHWPQPGLIARTSPITRVRRVAYIGLTYNGNLALDEAAWRARFAAQGFEFHAPEMQQWHDFSQFDACVAIRSFDRRTYRSKPASKLFNAWHAGVPLIAGHDSAYCQVGHPGEDYLVASSMPEVLDWLLRLDRDGEFRDGLVANGRRRAAEFGNAEIVRLWIAALEGPIAKRFELWQSRPGFEAVRHSVLAALDRGWAGIKGCVRKLIAPASRP